VVRERAWAAEMGRIRVGILFGGRSGEHEVSLMSARSVIAYLDKTKYEVVPLGITKEGRWLATGDPMKELQARVREVKPDAVPSESGRELVAERRELVPGVERTGIPHVDVVFPLLHGPFGEDGTVQGLLELADIPYVGADVLGSALAMDKVAMKAVFRAEALPVADYLPLMRWDWEENPTAVLQRIEEHLGFPCFVKPANLGSSVGITKVHEPEELTQALDLAARYDRKLLVEVAVNAREIECSVLGNDHPIASLPGEVIPEREFYDYVAKYFDEQTQLVIPADLSQEKTTEIQELAVRAFLALDLAGMARADFFLCKDSGQVYVNELNSIPGFTHASMYPKLWEASGLSYPELLDRLIELALERHEDRSRRSVSHEADNE
jgi:D-alanine-D-alanine ligase